MKVTPIKKKFGKYLPGDEFHLPDKAAHVFIRVGTLREVVPLSRSEQVQQLVGDLDTVEVKPKRQYRRRDMQAET